MKIIGIISLFLLLTACIPNPYPAGTRYRGAGVYSVPSPIYSMQFFTGGTYLNDAEIRSLIIGRQFIGVSSRHRSDVLFVRNGTAQLNYIEISSNIRSKQNGTWVLSNGQICTRWTKDPGNCYHIVKSPDGRDIYKTTSGNFLLPVKGKLGQKFYEVEQRIIASNDLYIRNAHAAQLQRAILSSQVRQNPTYKQNQSQTHNSTTGISAKPKASEAKHAAIRNQEALRKQDLKNRQREIERQRQAEQIRREQIARENERKRIQDAARKREENRRRSLPQCRQIDSTCLPSQPDYNICISLPVCTY